VSLDAFRAIVSPAASPQAPRNTFVEGQVYDVGPAGMRFTVKDWDGGKHVFGPAPWPMSRVEPVSDGIDPAHDHPETRPTAGARVLILFLGEGIDRSWIVGWWPA
jgi:hypothetical protein